MSVDRKAREELQHALVSYMAGDIRSFEFDDRLARLQRKRTTTDNSVRQISKELWYIYDDCIDHPISVNPKTWAALQRILAFLHTDLEVEEPFDKDAWPFHSPEEWLRNAAVLNEVHLPQYDPAVHSRRVHILWDRQVPPIVTVGIILGFVVFVLVVILRF